MTAPRVTVVLVYTPEGATEEERIMAPPSGGALRAWASVKEQDYGSVDVVLVNNAQGLPVEELQVYGAKQAQTDWVAFIRETDEWAPKHLSSCMAYLLASGSPQLLRYGTGVEIVNLRESLMMERTNHG